MQKTRNQITQARFFTAVTNNYPDLCILDNVVNYYDYVKVQCNVCGHIWNKKASTLYYIKTELNGCPQCKIHNQALSLNEIQKKISELNNNIEVIKKINNKYIQVKCLLCGHIANTQIGKAISKEKFYVCQKCSSRKKTYHDDFIIDTFDKNQYAEKFDIISQFSGYSKKIKIQCKQCKYEWFIRPTNFRRINKCPKCEACRSKYEFEIIDWLKQLNIENIQHNVKIEKQEIDVFLENYSLGIEFNGIYFHSDLFLQKDYHKNKHAFFKNKNIKLIQIFENEWINKKEIVKSIIRNNLNKNNTMIYARQCKIIELNNQQYKTFMEQNHIQGYANAKIYYGLFFDNNIVSCVSFGASRFNALYEYEIIRFANKLNTNIVGGFSKLLKHFEREQKPKNLISFCDARYFDGNIYLQNGFTLQGHTAPNYYYANIKQIHLYHRSSFQKHKLAKKLKNFDAAKSEYENMIANGYLRIYDAGNLKFVKEY